MQDVGRAMRTAVAGPMEGILIHTTGGVLSTDVQTSAYSSMYGETAYNKMNGKFAKLSETSSGGSGPGGGRSSLRDECRRAQRALDRHL